LADDPENGIPLKLQHFPETFFRYRKVDTYTFESLEKNELYLSCIEDLNDPFECAISLDHNACLKMFFSSDQFAARTKNKGGIPLTHNEIRAIIDSDMPYETYRILRNKKGFTIQQTSEGLYQRVMARWREI